MTIYYYAIFTVFSIIVYMIVMDKNVAIFIDLMIKYIGVQFQRFFWLIRFHPANPIARWSFNRRVEKMTRELEKSLKIDTKGLTDPD